MAPSSGAQPANRRIASDEASEPSTGAVMRNVVPGLAVNRAFGGTSRTGHPAAGAILRATEPIAYPPSMPCRPVPMIRTSVRFSRAHCRSTSAGAPTATTPRAASPADRSTAKPLPSICRPSSRRAFSSTACSTPGSTQTLTGGRCTFSSVTSIRERSQPYPATISQARSAASDSSKARSSWTLASGMSGECSSSASFHECETVS